MHEPRPISLTQVDEENYTGRRPENLMVVGPIPGGGDGGSGIQSVSAGDNVTVDDSDPQNPIISSAGTSAYQEWISQGNSGTESDFLASLKGADGVDGAQGAPGLPGGDGAEGIRGPRGERGEDGTSIVIDGYVATEVDLPDLTGDPAGSSYIVMATGHIHFWNGTDWTDGGNVTGPRGTDGEPGDQGPKGAQGDPGIQGVKGDPGEGLPTGGEDGEVLLKSGVEDYTVAWAAKGRLPIILTQAEYDALSPKVSGQIYVTYTA